MLHVMFFDCTKFKLKKIFLLESDVIRIKEKKLKIYWESIMKLNFSIIKKILSFVLKLKNI